MPLPFEPINANFGGQKNLSALKPLPNLALTITDSNSTKNALMQSPSTSSLKPYLSLEVPRRSLK